MKKLLWTAVAMSAAGCAAGSTPEDPASMRAAAMPSSTDDIRKDIEKAEYQTPAQMPAVYHDVLSSFPWLPGYECSASYVGNGVLLTAGHCFMLRDRKTPLRAKIVLPHAGRSPNAPLETLLPGHRIGGETAVRWSRWEGEKATVEFTSCVEILAIENTPERDFAVLRLDRVPSFVDAIPVWLGARPVEADHRTLTIFSYPGGEIRRSLPCPWSDHPKDISPAFLPTFPTSPSVFFYQCDTRASSSGGAVVNDDPLTPDGLYLLGVHNDGYTPEKQGKWGWNWATSTSDETLRQALLDAGVRGWPPPPKKPKQPKNGETNQPLPL